VFDFRFEAEAAAAPDRIIDGVTYTHLSTMPKLFVGAFSSSAGDSSGSEQIDTKVPMTTAPQKMAAHARLMSSSFAISDFFCLATDML
jgi:hypothetical protein